MRFSAHKLITTRDCASYWHLIPRVSMTMTNIFIATVRVKRVACGRVGFEGCRVPPYMPSIHHASHTLCSPVYCCKRKHLFWRADVLMHFRARYISYATLTPKPVEQNLPVSALKQHTDRFIWQRTLSWRITEGVEASSHLFLDSALDGIDGRLHVLATVPSLF